METAQFPKRYPDGSFCVEVIMTADTTRPDQLEEQAAVWLSTWVRTNDLWVRDWSSGQREELHFSECFAGVPTVTFCSTSELRFQLVGKPSAAKTWKDWLVLRLIKELVASVPEVTGFKAIEDCA
jgi:hypothetical protein